MTLRAIFFDLDNTLVDSDAAYELALRAAGTSGKDENFVNVRALVKKRIGEGHVSARNRLIYFKEMLRRSGSFSSARNLELMDKYERALEAELGRQWQALRRKELMERLRTKYTLVLVTNENTRTQLVKLRALDPTGELFHDMVTSEECGVEKPHPKIFEVALELFKLKPHECAMVGDNYECDMEPASKLGMRCYLTEEFYPCRDAVNVPLTRIKKLDKLEGVLP